MGSAWRGALGHALRKTVCVTREKECEQCMLYESCVYPYLFETHPPKDSKLMRCYRTVPHPFILQLPFSDHSTSDDSVHPQQGESDLSGKSPGQKRVVVGLVLIGKAQQQLPYLIHALQKAGVSGIGPRRTALQLVSVEQSSHPDDQEWREIYQPEQKLQNQGAAHPDAPALNGKVEIQLLTPFRTKREGHLLTPDHFSFASFFSPLLRRISMLQSFHGDHQAEADFRQLTEQARAVRIDQRNLHWFDWTRYSSRQRTTMQMGGIIGTFEITAEQLLPFRDWLWVGQWTHNGKGATMGLGQYRIKEKTA